MPACCPIISAGLPFLGRLRYVVVDELHALRGVFGTHAAHVLRRFAPHLRHLRRAAHVRFLVGHHR
jgi:ATP-dependent helicase YprA (DUF1998 family)